MSGDRPEEPGPVEPVLGVDEHVEDVQGLDPFRDPSLQRLDVLRFLSPWEPPENGLAVLDPEELVVREAPVGLGRDAGQVVLQVGHERAALHREADLFSIPGHAPLVLRPGDELAAIVGELVAPLDAEVTGLEFRDDLREETDLEVPAVHLGREAMAIRRSRDELPPFVGDPREIERFVRIEVEPIAPAGPVRAQEPEGVLDRGILAGRGEPDLVQEFEQGLAVTLVEAPQQREVVVVGIRGVGLAVLEDLLGLIADHGAHRGQGRPCRALVLHHGHQVMQDRDELIGSALLTLAVVREGFFAVVVDLGHAFDEGLAQVVEGASHLRPDEGRGQRVALLRLGLQHACGVQALRLGGEVLDLDVSDGFKGRGPDVQRLQPVEAVDEVLEVRQRRSPRIFSDGVPRAASRGVVHGEDAVELAASLLAQGQSDAPVEAPIDLRPTTLRLLEQGRESGQLEAVPDEFLDRDVDEVGQVVLRLCRLAHDRRDRGREPRCRRAGR